MKKRKMKMFKAVMSMLLLAALLLSGCGNMSAPGASAGTDGPATNSDSAETDSGNVSEIVIGVLSEPPSLDPAFNYVGASFYTVPQICEPLLSLSTDGKLEPNLASSWEQVDDVTYVYQIRDDVTFSDGSQMTVDDVVYCLNRVLDPEVGSSVNWMIGNVESVQATGDWEVTVKLSQPDATWQYMPAICVGQIYSKASCEAAGDVFGTKSGGIIGTGPYVLESWTSGSEIVMTKNENYWRGTDDIDIDKVTFKIFSDNNAIMLAATAGQVDLVFNPSNDLLEQYYEAENLNVQAINGFAATSVYFNCQSEYLSDENMRKAVAACLDSDGIKEAAYGDDAESATLYPFGSACYIGNESDWTDYAAGHEQIPFDLELAKEYLAKTDYPDGGITMNIIVNADSKEYMIVAQSLQYELSQIGITADVVECTSNDWETYMAGGVLNDDGTRAYDILIFGWMADYPDPINFLDPIYNSAYDCVGGTNYPCYHNDEVDSYIYDQGLETTAEGRTGIMLEAFGQIAEDCPVKHVCYQKSMFVLSNEYEYTFSPCYYFNFEVKDIKIK